MIWESLKNPEQYSVLWAEWRRRLKNLQNAVLGPWGGTHEELGTIANPTPQIVTNEMGFAAKDMVPIAPIAPPSPDFDREMQHHAAHVPQEHEQSMDR